VNEYGQNRSEYIMSKYNGFFDLGYREDLPDEIKNNLKDMKKIKITVISMIMELFKIKNTLSVDEIIVGLFRKFNIVKSRMNVVGSLYYLKLQGELKITGIGVYSLIEEK
jgi:hypothetical protein